MQSKKIGIWGAGSWATALAISLAKNGRSSMMWARRPNVGKEINQEKRNQEYLGGLLIPDAVTCTTDLEEVVEKTDILLSVVPSYAFRETLQKAIPFMKKDMIVVNAAKGLEEGTLKRMSQVFYEETGENGHYLMLSGPSHAEEVCQGIPTAVVLACENEKLAKDVSHILASESFRVYTNPDVAGVELGGALKNVIALATGIADGLGYGDNAKAALMTRGLAEIIRLGSKMGASPHTFGGLTGVGDLIVTCTSMHSRNRRVGIEIGKGLTLKEAMDNIHMVAEGVKTTKVARQIGQNLGVDLPITNQTYEVLFEGLSPKIAVKNLMNRVLKNEIDEFLG